MALSRNAFPELFRRVLLNRESREIPRSAGATLLADDLKRQPPIDCEAEQVDLSTSAPEPSTAVQNRPAKCEDPGPSEVRGGRTESGGVYEAVVSRAVVTPAGPFPFDFDDELAQTNSSGAELIAAADGRECSAAGPRITRHRLQPTPLTRSRVRHGPHRAHKTDNMR